MLQQYLTPAEVAKVHNMAQDGYVWEDIIVKLELPRTGGVKGQVRRMVLKGGWMRKALA